MRLAQEVEPGRMYPEDEVVRRITGYASAIAEPALLVGEALLGDLSAFAERLSRGASLSTADAGAGAIEIGELCRRWAVTRKSLERYRRRGLIALRVRNERGRERTLFPLASVQWFEKRHAEALAGAAKAGRIPEPLRERMVRRAARYRRTVGLSTSAIAARLAKRFGKSREGVRRLLVRHGGGEADSAAQRKRIDEAQRRALWRAWNAGASPKGLARRWGRSVASVHRLVNQERAAMLRALDLGGPDAELFEDPRAGDALLRDPAVRAGIGVEGEADAAEFIRAASEDEPMGAKREATLAAAMLLLKSRAERLIAGVSRADPSSSALDRAETMLRWAARLKAVLVRSQRGLILRTLEERLGAPLESKPADEAEGLILRAIEAAASGSDRFDPFKGGRLAAPVSMALARAIRLSTDSRGRESVAAARAPLEDWPRRIAPWQAWLEPAPALLAAISAMESREREVLEARFGLHGERPLTLAEVKERFGVTEERLVGWIRRGTKGQRDKGTKG